MTTKTDAELRAELVTIIERVTPEGVVREMSLMNTMNEPISWVTERIQMFKDNEQGYLEAVEKHKKADRFSDKHLLADVLNEIAKNG